MMICIFTRILIAEQCKCGFTTERAKRIIIHIILFATCYLMSQSEREKSPNTSSLLMKPTELPPQTQEFHMTDHTLHQPGQGR